MISFQQKNDFIKIYTYHFYEAKHFVFEKKD